MSWLQKIQWGKLFGFGKRPAPQGSPAGTKLGLAVKALQKCDVKEALLHLDQALILEPNSVRVLLFRAGIQADLGKLSDALADCTEALRHDPVNFTALNLRSVLHIMNQETEKGLVDLQSCYKLRPDDRALMQQLAGLLQETNHFDEAIELYSKLLAAKPEPSLFLSRGRCWADLKKFDLAINDYNEALRLDPNLLDAVDARAHAAVGASEFGSAIADYSEYLKMHPRHAETYYNRALSHRKKGDLREAIADYTKAITLNPDFEKAFFNRGFAYNRLGEYAQAEADFRKAAELEPSKHGPPNGLAWLFATCPDAQFRNGTSALEWVQKAYSLSEGKIANVLDTMAAAYAELGEFEAAIEWEKRYLGLNLTPKEIEEGRKRLELYQAKQPFREDPPSTSK